MKSWMSVRAQQTSASVCHALTVSRQCAHVDLVVTTMGEPERWPVAKRQLQGVGGFVLRVASRRAEIHSSLRLDTDGRPQQQWKTHS